MALCDDDLVVGAKARLFGVAGQKVAEILCGVARWVGGRLRGLRLCCGAMAPTKGLPVRFDVSSRCLSKVWSPSAVTSRVALTWCQEEGGEGGAGGGGRAKRCTGGDHGCQAWLADRC